MKLFPERYHCVNCRQAWDASAGAGKQTCRACGSKEVEWANHPLNAPPSRAIFIEVGHE